MESAREGLCYEFAPPEDGSVENIPEPAHVWLRDGFQIGTDYSSEEYDVLNEWVARTEVRPLGWAEVAVTVVGESDAAVVIDDIDVIVDERRSSSVRESFSYQDDCGSGFSPRYFDMDLNGKAPQLILVPAMEGGEKVATEDFPFKVSQSDPERFVFRTRGVDMDTFWHLEMHISNGTRSQTVEIRPKSGSSFVTLGEGALATAEGAPTGPESGPSRDASGPLLTKGIVDYTRDGTASGVVVRNAVDISELEGSSRSFRDFVSNYHEILENLHSSDNSDCAEPDLEIHKFSAEGFAYGTSFNCHIPAYTYVLMAQSASGWQAIYDGDQAVQPCALLKSFNFPAALLSFSSEFPNNYCLNGRGESVTYE